MLQNRPIKIVSNTRSSSVKVAVKKRAVHVNDRPRTLDLMTTGCEKG